MKIDCEVCNDRKLDNFQINDLKYNKKVRTGDEIEISFTVTCLNTFFSGDTRVCLSQNSVLVDSTPIKNVSRWTPYEAKLRLVMPNSNVRLRLSLLGQNILSYDCEDYKDLYIIKSNVTEEPEPEGEGAALNLYVVGLIGLGALAFYKVIK